MLGLGIATVAIPMSVVLWMYYHGGVYSRKRNAPDFKNHETSTKFCDIGLMDLELPLEIRNDVYRYALDKSNGRRVHIWGWKKGRTIPTHICLKDLPTLASWYCSCAKRVSQYIGLEVETTPLNLPTSCAVLVYEDAGDFINWHYDVNYFKGQFFTVLVPVSLDDCSTRFMYKNGDGDDVSVNIPPNRAMVFEGEKVFHMASKLVANEHRVLISLQFVTNCEMTAWSKFLINVKDIAFVGINRIKI